MKSSFPHPIRRILTGRIAAALVALIPLGQTAHAAGGSWNVDAAGNWSSTGNWTPAAVPGTAAGDVVNLLFNISAARIVTIDTTSRSVGDLNIGDPTATFGAYTLAASGGAVLNLDGTGTADATIDFTGGIGNTISAPLTLVDNGVIRSNVAFVQTLSGVISGAGKTLTYNNDTNGVGNPATALQGQFLVNGNNTYTGGTTISDVRVNITTNNTALGAAGSAVTIQNGGQVHASTALATINYAFNIAGNGWAETSAGNPFGALRLDGGSIVTGTVAMSANAAIGSTGTGTVSGVVSGGFTLSKRGAGTLTLSGANNYSNGTILDGASGSILVLGNATAAGSGAITWAAGTLARLRVNGGVTIANPITIPAGLVGIGNTGLLEQTGTGLATYNGPITISGSTANGGHIFGSNTVGNEIVLGGVITSSVTVSQRDGRVIYKGGGTGYTLLGVSGTVLVGATNGIATTASINLGASTVAALDLNGFDQELVGLNLGSGGAFNTTTTLGAKTLTLTGNLSTLSTGTHVITGTGAIALGANAATFTVADGAAVNDLTISSLISGSAGFTKAGAGTLILNGNVTNTGTLAVTGGTLGGNTALSGALTVSAGGTLQPGTNSTVGTVSATAVTFDVGATTLNMDVGAGGDFISTGALVTNGTATVNAFQLGGILANGTYNLIGYTGTSPGVAGFSLAPVSHALATLVDTGTAIALQVTGNDRMIWDGTNTTSWVTGVTQNWKRQSNLAGADYIESDDVIFQDLPTNSSVDLPVNVAPSKVSFTNTVATTYTVTGAAGIIGTAGLTKTGNGTVILRTQNSYVGATTVTAGTLELDHDATGNQVLTASSGVSIAPIATLRLTRDDGAFTYSRNTTGTGFLEVNPHSVAGGVVAHTVSFTGDNSGFTGSLRLLAPLTGTYRLGTPTVAQLGAGTVEVQSGAQLFVSGAITYNNPLIISGTGFVDSAGNIGALRLDAGAVWAGNIAVNGTARIGSHNSTGTISGNISGGDVEFNATNFNNGYTTILTGTNTYGATTIGGQNIQVAGVPSMRVNIGNGGTTGTLGSGNVIINGDGANGVLGFDRSNGYTLLPGQTITGAVGAGTVANSIARTFIDFDTLGTGFSDNGNAIALGAATSTTGGQFRVGQSRANAVASFSGALTGGILRIGSGQGNATVNLNSGAVANFGNVHVGLAGGTSVLNINSGSSLTADYLTAGEAANISGIINQAAGTTVNIASQLRVGHFSTETSTYNMSGGTLTLTGASPSLIPSTATGGGASATGDNNINALVTPTILGGGIYLGTDGTGVLNHTGGTVTTNWIVLDNRTDSVAGVNMPDGIDRYNLSGAGSVLALRSTWGLIQRNVTAAVSFGGGTVRVDNTGTGTGTGANLTIPLDATIDTVASTTTSLDTNGAGNGFTLNRDVRGTGTLNLIGGGTINLTAAAFQNITPAISGTATLNKLGGGTTNLNGSGAGYTGAVTVTLGQLNVPNDLAAASITLADGTVLGGEPTVGTLTLGTAVRSDLIFNPNTAGALTAGTLNAVAASNILSFSEAPAGAGPWTALNYTTKTGAGTFGLAGSGAYRVAPAVTDTGSSITVNVTGTKALTWTGTGAVTTVWDNNGNTNWVDATPAPDNFFAGDTVTFGDGPSVVGVTVTSGVSPWKTTVNSNTNNYTLTSTVSGLAGPGSLEKSGASTLTLVGPNSYSGKTVISGGTLSIAAATSLGSAAATNSIALSGGAKLTASATLDLGLARGLAVGPGGGTLSAAGAAALTVTVPGNLSGSAPLTFTSGATVAPTYFLSGNNSGFSGNVNLDSAGATATGTVLALASSNALTAGTLTMTFPPTTTSGVATTVRLDNVTISGVTLAMSSNLNGAISQRGQLTTGTGVNVWNGPVTLAGNDIIQINTAHTLTLNGSIAAAGGGFTGTLFLRGASPGVGVVSNTINAPAGNVNKTDSGLWTINSSVGNSWVNSVVAVGTLRMGATGVFPAAVNLTLGQNDTNTAVLDLNGFSQTVGSLASNPTTVGANTTGKSITTAAAATLTVNQASTTTYASVLTGGTALVKSGAGTLTLSGASSFTGNVTVSDGTLVAGGATVTSLGSATTAGRTVTVSTPGALSFTANNVFGNGVGNSSLPSTIVNGATFSSTRYNVLGNLTLNGGTLTQAATDAGNYEGFQFRGSVTVGGAAPSAITTANAKANHLGANTIFDVANVTGDASDDLTVSAPLRNQSGDFALAAGALTKNGLGTMTLSAANVFTGGITINGGTLKVTGPDQSSNRLVANTLVIVNPGGVFETADVTNNTAPGTFAIDLALAGGTYRLTGAANNHQHIRNVSFTAGGTVETQGTVGNYVGTNAQLNGDVTVTGAAPATIAMQNGLGINGSHTFTVADVTGTANPDLTFTGTGIQQSDAAAGVVVKAGAGTLAINGPSSYTGGLSINAGTVSVVSDTALGGAVATVAINNGAKLQATGPVTSVRTFILGLGGGKIDTNGQTVLLDTAGIVTGTALEKTGAGTLDLKATQTYGALTTSGGTTNIYSALGTGTSTITANATTNIYASQTLASLSIGAGAAVTFGDGLPFAPEPEKGGSFSAPLAPQAAGAVVPEPGSISLLVVGSLGLLARRRRAA